LDKPLLILPQMPRIRLEPDSFGKQENQTYLIEKQTFLVDNELFPPYDPFA
jgi:hypothetical protein